MMYFVQARHSSSGFWPSSLEGAVVVIGPLHLTANPQDDDAKVEGLDRFLRPTRRVEVGDQ
jgi:hypothetical protein